MSVKLQFCGILFIKRDDQQQLSYDDIKKKMSEWHVPCFSCGDGEDLNLIVVLSEYNENARITAECPELFLKMDEVARRTQNAILREFPSTGFIDYFIRATTVTEQFAPLFPKIKMRRLLSFGPPTSRQLPDGLVSEVKGPLSETYIEEWVNQ